MGRTFAVLAGRLWAARSILAGAILASLLLAGAGQAADPLPARNGTIVRVIPPPGIDIAEPDQARLRERLGQLNGALAALRRHPHAVRIAPFLPDVQILLRGVNNAVELGEFFQPGQVQAADRLLDLAAERLQQLDAGNAPWGAESGNVVRGFVSRIDDTVQPYGLVIPRELDRSRPVPLIVWLHGRGDTMTELAFLTDRLKNPGQVAPSEAIVLHPYGRFCNAFKFAGETDVLEAVDAVQRHYRIDPDRIALMGFSMGGAGAWHLAAHHPDRWCAASPGAGFAETARYQGLDPMSVSTAERMLWQLYDVPPVVRNLFNLPVIAYSGELDKQIQAARVMEEAFAKEGRTLAHLIGPQTAHAYHPETLGSLRTQVSAHLVAGIDRAPREITFQTATLRHNRCHWVEVLGLQQHWQTARVDAALTGTREFRVATSGISFLALHATAGEDFRHGAQITIDGQTIRAPVQEVPRPALFLEHGPEGWNLQTQFFSRSTLRKRKGLHGPIDDVFFEPFWVVPPDGPPADRALDRWVEAELELFSDRWRRLFRGNLPIRQASEVTYDDMLDKHLVLWGDPQSNSLIRRMQPYLPFRWDEEKLLVGEQSYAAAENVPALIFPNLLTTYPARCVVINSGPTFRPGHDRTNSRQTPQLPDWAVIGLDEAPSDLRPGRIRASGFFDELWRYNGSLP